MGSGSRVLLALVIAVIAVAGLAEESSAAAAGGSRLLFYYTQQSIVNAGAGPGSANTVIGITNSGDAPVGVRAQIFNGQSCTSAEPVNFSVGSRQTVRLVASALGGAAQFPEGWVDVWAVNGAGTPIRWDALAGKATLLDFGGSAPAAALYAAAALFSDRGGVQGDPIPDLNNGNTWAPLGTIAEFWGVGGPNAVGTRLVVLPVSKIPGTAPGSETPLIRFTHEGGGAFALTATNGPGCLVAAPLTALHPDFAATFPASGGLPGGGNILAQQGDPSPNKGVVGVFFEFTPVFGGLLVTPLQSVAGATLEVHE